MLSGVAPLSPTDVWAVGEKSQHSTTMHWNGVEWSEVPNPVSLPRLVGQYDRLFSVEAIASDNVGAVGNNIGVSTEYAIVLHWDGKQWLEMVLPKVSSGMSLLDVAKDEEGGVWMVGGTYNGKNYYGLTAHFVSTPCSTTQTKTRLESGR